MNKKYLTYCAVDFDGTMVIHNYPYIGAKIGAAPVLRFLSDKCKVKIILNTVRDNSTLDDAVNWCHKNGISLYGVNANPDQKSFSSSTKVHADCYIDDLNIGIPLKDGHVDWTKVLDLLKETFSNVEKQLDDTTYRCLVQQITDEQSELTSSILKKYGY